MSADPAGMQQGLSRWRSAVAAVLAKSTRRDPADLPAEPERLLDSPTYEAFPVRPLYTSLDELPEPPLPGQWPYVRGGDALRDVKSGWKGADPFTAPLSQRSGPSQDDVVATAARVAGFDGGVRAITVDGPAFHNHGASASWELAGSVAAGVAYLRLLRDGGLGVRDALRQISFRFAADDDQFMTIGKLRAARQLWARVAELLGDPDAGVATIHAVTSLPMMAERDPWVNMLRTTLAAFGAGVGGADTVLVQPFDVAIPGGFPGIAAGFSRRIARNTQLLLLEESHIGRVLDPAAGSWFVEDLTEQLAEQAWTHFREIEKRGGFVEARDFVAEQIAKVRDRR